MKSARRIMTGLLIAVVGLGAGLAVFLHHEGYHAYIVHTGSMTGSYDSGGLVIDRPVGDAALHRGQTITYLHGGPSPELITHRIVGLHHGTIQTKGDANKIRDTWNTAHSEVRGVVVHYLPYMGYVVYYLSHRAGDLSIVTALLALILLWDVFLGSYSAGEADLLRIRDEPHDALAVPQPVVAPGDALARMRRGRSARAADRLGHEAVTRLRDGRALASNSR